jgi:hypothetical protein
VAACAVIYAQGLAATWAEVVRTAGVQKVLVHALTHEGDWEWGGFAVYARKELGAIEVDKARSTARRLSRKKEKVPA